MPRKREGSAQRSERELLEDAVSKYGEVLVKMVERMYGESGRKIIEYLIKTGGAPEETLGKEAGVKSNEARKILQKLGNDAFVYCRGRKVGDKVLHYWFINWNQLDFIFRNRLLKTRRRLEILLNHLETSVIYACSVCGKTYDIDKAFDYDFKCPQDGGELVEVRREPFIELIRRWIGRIDGYLSSSKRTAV